MSDPVSDAPTADELLANPVVRAALDAAWADSFPDDPVLRHEEGGWVYCDPATGSVTVRRAQSGFRDGIILDGPPLVPGSYVVATYHTHPNPTAVGWLPEPSPSDRELMDEYGVPGLIVSDVDVYRVGPDRRRGGLTGDPGYPS